jgi:YHS domain-containing protein
MSSAPITAGASKPVSHDEHFLALEGYDPVSYFDGQPLPGRSEHSLEHAGVTYRFASDSNKRRFHADPERFLPQYGGFCAVAVSEGKLVPVDPLTYTLTDDRLYLFYNGEHGNTKPQWQADEQGMKVAADTRWAMGHLLPL